MENKTELIVILAVILIAFSVSTIVVTGMPAFHQKNTKAPAADLPRRSWTWRWPWETQKSAPAPTCTDSDGGRNYYAQGEIYVNGNPQQADGCQFKHSNGLWYGRTVSRRGDPGRLVEAYCDGGARKEEYVDIPAGYICEAGKFVQGA